MYTNDKTWIELQEQLRPQNRISKTYFPEEKYVTFNDITLHLDEYNPKERKRNVSVIIFHGVGGNGRLLSFMAVPLVRNGYSVICPDLPGYGYTDYKLPPTYQTWIDVGGYIVDQELKKNKKVFIIGLSAGGMLAYNVACNQQDIRGLIVTNILDNREEEVRNYSAKNKFQANTGLKLLNVLPSFIKKIKIPIKMVTNMKGLVNNQKILNILLRDKHGAGCSVQINFLLTMMNHRPIIEAENFTKVPVLLAHPGNDLWTPIHVSELFFDRIMAKKQKIILKNAGHFPLEQPGLDQMEQGIIEFIENLT